MASEKKDAVRSDLDPVQVRNVTRQAIHFQVPGRSVHLLPGRTVELPKAYLETGEVAVLMKGGALVRLATAAPEAEAAAGSAEGTPADKTTRRGKK